MYTNSAPMGDARVFNISNTNGISSVTPAAPALEGVSPAGSVPATPGATDTPMEVTTPTPPRKQKNRKSKVVKEEDLGKIQTFSNSPSKEESTVIPGENSHCIVSPR